MAGDESGHVWLGTDCGVSRFTPPKTDGEEGTWLSIEGGLHTAAVVAIAVGADGELWFGHEDGLVTRYGDTAKVLTHEDGLKPGLMRRILVDGGGRLWFSVFGAGIVRYDGLVFQDLSQRDGLISDSTLGMCQDRDGAFWIATDNGVTRYCPVTTPPAVRIREVVADRTYGAGDGVTLHASQELVQISFQGRSLSTAPDRMAYVYRLRGRLDEWQATRQRRVQLTGLDEGEYVFEVRAVDLDLNYSEPATVRITVEPDPRDQALAQALSAGGPMGEFVGSSPALRQVQQQLAQAAPTDLAVLILGETGTGKGLAARLVHELSPRQEHALIQVNCGAIPGGLVESELFGHEKGAFTSAVSRHLGKAELAHGGTLFLDEIGDFPLEAQVKLLRLLEEGTFERVGGTKVLEADVRIVAATNRDLEEMVRDDRLRPDLYYRLQGFPVRLPPLRERLDDVELLALYFAERMANHLNKPAPALSTAALDLLRSYDWPGNVRELEHAIQRATIVCGGPVLEPGDVALGYGPSHSGPDAQGSVATLAECERSHILQVLERTGWRISGEQGAADLLGVPVSTLRSRMKKLAIERPRD